MPGRYPGRHAGRNMDGGRGMDAIAARPTEESRYDIVDCTKLMSVSSESGEIAGDVLLSLGWMDSGASLTLVRRRERVLSLVSWPIGCIDMNVSEE